MNKYRNILFESPRPFIIIQLENDRLIINETNIDTKNDLDTFVNLTTNRIFITHRLHNIYNTVFEIFRRRCCKYYAGGEYIRDLLKQKKTHKRFCDCEFS